MFLSIENITTQIRTEYRFQNLAFYFLEINVDRVYMHTYVIQCLHCKRMEVYHNGLSKYLNEFPRDNINDIFIYSRLYNL